jgi:hypothetical protein
MLCVFSVTTEEVSESLVRDQFDSPASQATTPTYSRADDRSKHAKTARAGDPLALVIPKSR